MQSLTETKNLLFAHLRDMPSFYAVRKMTVNELADRSFWDGIHNALTPCGVLVLKESSDEGRARQRRSVWGFVIIVQGNGEDVEDRLLALVEEVQVKLMHFFEGKPGLMLLPNSKLTMLETGSDYMAAEVEMITEDSD